MIDYTIKLILRQEAEDIIKIWHYSHSLNGVMSTYCFGLFDEDVLIGVMVLGNTAMHNQWKKYTDKKENLIELRRLAIIDNTPKNTESYFIGYVLRWLKKNTNIKMVLSYADSNYNHVGTIYKASNFKYLGLTSLGKVIMWQGKKYHDKAIRTKYNGKLKPYAQRLKTALDIGEATIVKQQPKYIFIYYLKR